MSEGDNVGATERRPSNAAESCAVGGTVYEADFTPEIEQENLITCVAKEGKGNVPKSDNSRVAVGASPSVSSITFHDLGYEVTQRKCFRKLPNKIILDSVSGEIRTGLNAIMGPTGSGKTTLLDLLADRKDKTGRSGKVLINGQKRQANYKTMVGYVVQDDVVMGTLSVRENLEFSAALRLPGHMTRAQRKERVERVIETLGLYRCADTKERRSFEGCLGGERKRTNIGMELIIEPQVLFLDEPTTGLDAHTAVSVVSLLKSLSVNEKRVIVLSIHQPRYSIFKLFDSLTLLSQGSTVYHGPAHLALAYFDKLGLHCEEHENPADFFLDTIIHHEKQLRQSSRETAVAFTKTTVSEKEDIDKSAVCSESGEKMVRLVESYRKSEEYGELRERIDPVLQNVVEEKRKEPLGRQVARKMFTRELYATSFLWQLLIVTMRSVKNLMRSPQLSVFQVCIIGVFFFVSTNQAFGSLGAVRLFITQKALFIHENASGYYRVSAFFISKIATDLIPLRFLPNLLFTVIIYFMIGLQVKADKFFIFWLILTLVNVSAVSIAFFISAGVRNGEIANLLIILPFIFSLVSGTH
ncbi:Broad substrate specificity ATP-binding cassette transporter ABCG2 [Geodia barretti]|uniref:Broad substrate specificity ATP-binding cassette transporter ABCG2 n=1 Tax=Geodia barretti TaxID=519541 RepID=A0AA35W3R4_GEOBA|nr:Broad substrate specificity ATP-binding cassette transporter ABCG2 [Geodia barretti]